MAGGFSGRIEDIQEGQGGAREIRLGRQGRTPGGSRHLQPTADEMVMSTNIGLIDVVFRKGNCVGGANSAHERISC